MDYQAQQIMFNTRQPEEPRRKADIATMRISSFMINENNPKVEGLTTLKKEGFEQPQTITVENQEKNIEYQPVKVVEQEVDRFETGGQVRSMESPNGYEDNKQFVGKGRQVKESALSQELGLLTSKGATAHREYQIFTKFEDPEIY